MAYPKAVSEQPLISPAARPLLAVGLLPALAGRYFDYLPLGSLAGDVLTYRDLAGFGWWTPVNLYAATQANVSEDAGSIFEAVTAIAVDASINEAYPWGTPIESGDPLLMVEAFTPEQPSFQYYAVRTRNSDLRVTTTGETIMGRLARTIPPRLMLRTTSLPGAPDTITAQAAIQYILDQWTARYPWFAAETVPDLRLLVDEAVGNERQHYIDNPDSGIITTGAIVIPQEAEGDRDERKTMREIIDEWLAIFPGTVVRANSSGRLEIVARVGPDAPQVEKHLAWADIKRISDGENDPRGITNQARVVSQGYAPTDETALIAPSFLVLTAPLGISRELLDSQEVLPDDREEVQPWESIPFEALGTDADVTVEVFITAYGSWNRATASSWSVEGTQARTITLAPGESKDVTIQHNSRSQTVTARFAVTRDTNDSIVVVTPYGIPQSAENVFGRTYFAYVLDVDADGTAWVKGNRQVTGQFGYLPGDTLPGPDGTDALADSIASYGERGATINSSIFQLTPEVAQQVARAYVLQNISPRTVRDVQQTHWRRYPVRFDDIGRPIELPSGEVAIVEHRDYTLTSTESTLASSSSFSAVVTHSVLDADTPWLYYSNGSFFELDDGTIVEES